MHAAQESAFLTLGGVVQLHSTLTCSRDCSAERPPVAGARRHQGAPEAELPVGGGARLCTYMESFLGVMHHCPGLNFMVSAS